jgi:hypothetical protein
MNFSVSFPEGNRSVPLSSLAIKTRSPLASKPKDYDAPPPREYL